MGDTMRTLTLLLAGLFALQSAAAPAPATDWIPPSKLPDDVIKAWKKARAAVGWMGPTRHLPLVEWDDSNKELNANRAVPAFWVDRLPRGTLRKLPAPATPFGLHSGPNHIGDEELEEVAGLKSLTYLEFSGDRVTNAGFARLAALTNLRSLVAYHCCRVTDEGVKPLVGLKKLRHLELLGAGITNVSMTRLASLRQLKVLNLSGTKVGNEGLKPLAALRGLFYLNLGSTEVTDAGMKLLAPMKGLTALQLGGTKVGDRGVKALAASKSLVYLYLSGTKVTDVGLKELAKIPRLKQLNLSGTGVTDAGLKHLAGMKGLTHLHLGSETKVTKEGVAELKKALPKCEVHYEDPRESDGP
jgi:hypothetical protein